MRAGEPAENISLFEKGRETIAIVGFVEIEPEIFETVHKIPIGYFDNLVQGNVHDDRWIREVKAVVVRANESARSAEFWEVPFPEGSLYDCSRLLSHSWWIGQDVKVVMADSK